MKCVLYKKQPCARMYRMLYIWIFASKLNLLHVSLITNTQLRTQQTFHIFDVFPDVVSQWTAMTIRPSCPTQPTPESRKWETQGRFCFNLLDSLLKTVVFAWSGDKGNLHSYILIIWSNLNSSRLLLQLKIYQCVKIEQSPREKPYCSINEKCHEWEQGQCSH